MSEITPALAGRVNVTALERESACLLLHVHQDGLLTPGLRRLDSDAADRDDERMARPKRQLYAVYAECDYRCRCQPSA